jgi:hypothetical protein
MGIEVKITQIETDVKAVRRDMDFIKDELVTIRIVINKLIEQKNVVNRPETPKVKDTMCDCGFMDGERGECVCVNRDKHTEKG